MAFDLKVEFSGLSLYVPSPELDTDGNPVLIDGQVVIEKVGILMPDCRRREDPDPPRHLDGSIAVPHVGYVRLNLANIHPGLPSGTSTPFREPPEYELLHRFDRQKLAFDADFEPEPMTVRLDVPDFGRISSRLRRIPRLFEEDPPPELLMRTVLVGGQLTAIAQDNTPVWIIPRRIDRELRAPYSDRFASTVTWTRRVRGDTVTVRITGFGQTEPQATFVLRPKEDETVVAVKIANLCADNPLEWAEMNEAQVIGPDVDFKWLYTLVEHEEHSYPELLLDDELPVPHPNESNGVTGEEACMPGQLQGTF